MQLNVFHARQRTVARQRLRVEDEKNRAVPFAADRRDPHFDRDSEIVFARHFPPTTSIGGLIRHPVDRGRTCERLVLCAAAVSVISTGAEQARVVWNGPSITFIQSAGADPTLAVNVRRSQRRLL